MRLDSVETLAVQVSPKGNWNIVRLRASNGLVGLGEATHALGFTKASDEDDRRIAAAVDALFAEYLRGMPANNFEGFLLAAGSEVFH